MTILQLILYIFKRLYLLFEWRFISAKKYYKKAKSSIYATVANMLQLRKWRCSNWERDLRLQWTWQCS